MSSRCKDLGKARCYLVQLEGQVLNEVTSLRPKPGWYHRVLCYRLTFRCLECQDEWSFYIFPETCYDINGAIIDIQDENILKFHQWRACAECGAIFRLMLMGRGGHDLSPGNNTASVLQLRVFGNFSIRGSIGQEFMDTIWHYTRPETFYPDGQVMEPAWRMRGVELDHNNVLRGENGEVKIRLVVRVAQIYDQLVAGLLPEHHIEQVPGALIVEDVSPNASDYEAHHDYLNVGENTDDETDDDDDDDDDDYDD